MTATETIEAELEAHRAREDQLGVRVCHTCRRPTTTRAVPFVTQGGLTLPCAAHCDTCDVLWLPTRAQLLAFERYHAAASVPPGPWTIAKSGRSIDVGHMRLRITGGTQEEQAALCTFLASVAPASGDGQERAEDADLA